MFGNEKLRKVVENPPLDPFRLVQTDTPLPYYRIRFFFLWLRQEFRI